MYSVKDTISRTEKQTVPHLEGSRGPESHAIYIYIYICNVHAMYLTVVSHNDYIRAARHRIHGDPCPT
jgi:hypothetical protein